MAQATRADDERLLAALMMRYNNTGTDEIALCLGMKREGVRIATARVQQADEIQAGRDLSGDYWGHSYGPKGYRPKIAMRRISTVLPIKYATIAKGAKP